MRKWLKSALFAIVYFVSALLAFSANWGLRTWVGLTMDEMVYHLNSPLEGTGGGMIGAFILQCLLPACMIFVLAFIIFVKVFPKIINKWLKNILYFLPIIIIIITAVIFGAKVDFLGYMKGQVETSSFVQDHYVDANEVDLTFPEEKQNLVYIYLESMEMSFASKDVDGAYEQNYIPELTQLALENECFSGKQDELNGAITLPGTTWTMGAMMAQTSGLPLQLSVKHNAMSTQNHFFDQMETLGDLLQNEGYEQAFLLGSKATFGGRDTYFKQHGKYQLLDYKYAIKEGWIPEDYYEFWGFEDEKLFTHAKEEAIRLAKESKETGKPFNLTILTVDTHFEDGYTCHLCPQTYDDVYGNVIACSSSQVYDFVSWLQEQDFYENTVVVLSGDHLTMDSDFCGEIPSNYPRRTYLSIINGKAKKETNEKRNFSTFDLYPTTLAAMGVDIAGNKLGLGVNLYSKEKTLVEEYEEDFLQKELAKKSLFIEELANIDMDAVEKAGLLEDIIYCQVELRDYDARKKEGVLCLNRIKGITENTTGFQMKVYSDAQKEEYTFYEFSFDKETGSYVCPVSFADFDWHKGKIVCYAVGGSGALWETTDLLPWIYMEDSLLSYEADVADGSDEVLEVRVFGEYNKYLPKFVKKKLKSLGINLEECETMEFQDGEESYEGICFTFIDKRTNKQKRKIGFSLKELPVKIYES